MNRYDYFIESFNKINPGIIDIFAGIVDEIYRTKFDNHNDYISELLFHLYTNLDELRTFKSLKIGVYSDLGPSHANSLILSLQKHFAPHTFTLYDENETFDLIISTVDFNPDSSIDIITIADYMNSKSLLKIYNKIYIND